MKAKNRAVLYCYLLCVAVVGPGCSRDAGKSAEQKAAVKSDVVAKSTLLATIAEQEQPYRVDNTAVTEGSFYVDFNRSGTGVVYIANIGIGLCAVHNGKAGKPYKNIFNVRISPDGSRVAYVVELNGKQSLVIDGEEGPLYDDIGPPVFSPDSRHIAYKVQTGEQLHIVVDRMMSGNAYKAFNGAPVFSSDSRMIAYAEGAEENRPARLVVSDLKFRSRTILDSCGDQLVAAADGSRIAAVCEVNGKRKVVELAFDKLQKPAEGPLYDNISHPAFAGSGTALAYIAEKSGVAYLVMSAREEQLPRAAPVSDPVIRPDLQGAAIILGSEGKVYLYQVFHDKGVKENSYEMIDNLAYNGDGSVHAYAALKKNRWRIVVNGSEGPEFDRVVDPMFSPDGRRLVYRARQDGKRFVVVADAGGRNSRLQQRYELVYPTVFTADGTSVAYGVKEGRELWWKVEKLP